MIVLGLLFILAAVLFGIGVISMSENRAADTLTFFGYHFDTSTTGVFIAGAVGGALLLLGLALLIGAMRRSSHRRRTVELEGYRHDAESARQERDELLEARERQLAQERELHAAHEQELRRLHEADATKEPVRHDPDVIDRPAEERVTETRPITERTDTPTRVESRHRATEPTDVEHKEGFWHRIFGSPANRS